jgi:hypothetical protein
MGRTYAVLHSEPGDRNFFVEVDQTVEGVPAEEPLRLVLGWQPEESSPDVAARAGPALLRG